MTGQPLEQIFSNVASPSHGPTAPIASALVPSRRERELDVIRTSLRAATDDSETRQREAKRLAALLDETREEYAR